MEPRDPVLNGNLILPPHGPKSPADLDFVRPATTINNPDQPHCGDHAYFHTDCATCKQACANFQPYPVKKTKPGTRSFGHKDDLTAEKLRALSPRLSNLYADDPEFSLSLSVIRFFMKLIWPF